MVLGLALRRSGCLSGVARCQTPTSQDSVPTRDALAKKPATEVAHSPGAANPALFSPGYWGLPAAAVARLNDWGLDFVRKVRESGRSGLASRGMSPTWPTGAQLRLGTDCSGAEAPVWALVAMRIPHTHVFSCDIDPHVRSFIAATSPPKGPIYHDMLNRKTEDLPAHSIYCCGFPCKAFSSLRRHSTKLLKEKTARPFFALLNVIRHSRPLIVVLENVIGIRAVLEKVLGNLKQIDGYFIFVIPIDSADLGEPVSRPRFYFVLVRQDVAVCKDMSVLSAMVKGMHGAVCAAVVHHVMDRMLPASSPAVNDFQSKRMQVLW